MPVDGGNLIDEVKRPHSPSPFKNRNGTISYRVAGWLLGERIRKNFKTREAAILERGTLQLKQAQADSDLRVTPRSLLSPSCARPRPRFKLRQAARADVLPRRWP
ncbi:hypothetical protein OH491_22035 [Termitidicoccus mucosus]|uniref:hypothetical protein n=1 Tax=Termitidicoccus mucosus TaxID=1184151 RepID=UPI0031841B5C